MSVVRGLQLAGFARRHLGRMGRGRKEVLSHLADRRPETLPMPTFLQLRVTNLCNLRCSMCGQWGDTGIFRTHGNGSGSAGDGEREVARIKELIGLKRQLSLADYVKLLDEVAPAAPIVTLFGGEPFLYPEILPLIREIKRRGLTCSVITNGGRLEELARELVEAGIDSIAFSIDGPPDLHNKIRGRADSYQRAEAGIRAVAEWRRKLHSALPMQIAILPATELNLESIAPAVEALRDLPLDTINIGLRWFVPTEAGERYQQVMRETFGVEGASWKGFEFDGRAAVASRNGQMKEYARFLKGLRRRRWLDSASGKPWISFVPDVAPDQVTDYFAEFPKTFGHDLCPVAWYFAQVEPDGEVCFCGDFPDYFIGNVRKQSFREIWHGERAWRFRDKLAKEPLPICARCCGSFVYGKWSRES